jgi:hypothetical protein
LTQNQDGVDWLQIGGTTPPANQPKKMQQTIDQLIAEITAKSEQGNWVPACGGTETPFRSRSGKTLLYCWQPSTGRHAYLDCGTDIILSHEEATAALAI